MNGPYNSIIGLPHHEPTSRKRMPIASRAAQFAPFAALTGYDSLIFETARSTDERAEMALDKQMLINEVLETLVANLENKPVADFVLFVADKKKSGGAYVKLSGRVLRYDEYERTLMLEGGERILLDDIIEVEER